VYRWSLDRLWADYHLLRWARPKIMTFIMLNPSTADAFTDDPTLRRCIGFAQREECHGLRVINLFSYRTPDPDDLIAAIMSGVDPFGSRHDEFVCEALQMANGPIVAGWGANTLRGGIELGLNRLRSCAEWVGLDGEPLLCLGTTASGAPRHPLYRPAETPLIEWGVL
jgi:hypothetical protein